MFYQHIQSKGGYLKICKGCRATEIAEYRKENLDKIREYDRKRGRTEKRQIGRAHV